MNAAAAAAVAAVLLALTTCSAAEPAAKPDLYVLTSLPLVFDEGFSIAPAKGEAAKFLREHYTLKPIDLPSELPLQGTLLAAQPRALPVEELVALDAWVRGGGRMLLLADPMLEWPSKRPLGDLLRPPLAYPDTGLLLHWGLRLDALDKRGLKAIRSGDIELVHNSPGKLKKTGGTCRLEAEDVFADCQIEQGRVLVIADVDWLNLEAIKTAGGHPGDNVLAIVLLLETVGAKATL